MSGVLSKHQAWREWIDASASAYDDEVMLLDGWDHAIVGLLRDKQGELHVVYDQAIIVDDLTAQLGEYDEAYGYFSYNIEGLKPNRGGPLFVERPE